MKATINITLEGSKEDVDAVTREIGRVTSHIRQRTENLFMDDIRPIDLIPVHESIDFRTGVRVPSVNWKKI